MDIQWNRVAKPQADGYDSHIIGQVLKDKYGWQRSVPTSEWRLCEGTVGVVPDRTVVVSANGTSSDDNPENPMINGMPYATEERLSKIDHFLMAWPEGTRMLQLFMDEFWPKWSRLMSGEAARGSSSGHYEILNCMREGHLKGLVVNATYVTLNDPQGCCEGIYHEVGHARLESLGLNIDSHDNLLITNTQDELYDSPVRWDVKRPMSAVVQAIYSWIMLTEADIQCATNLTGIDIKDPIKNPTLTPAEASSNYMLGNIPKIQDGLEEIRKHAKLTPAGVDFMDGYLEWGDSVVNRGLTVLKEVYKENFDARYATALEYRVRREQVLREVAEKKKENENYQHGPELSKKLLKELEEKKNNAVSEQ